MHFVLFKNVNRLQLTHYVQSLKDVVIINIFLGCQTLFEQKHNY